jgi:hypothetical protein
MDVISTAVMTTRVRHCQLVCEFPGKKLLKSYCLFWKWIGWLYFIAAVDSDAANKMMDLIRDHFVNGDISAIHEDSSGIKLVSAEEFS